MIFGPVPVLGAMPVAIPVPISDVPELSTSQMVEVDRLMIERYRMSLSR
jgi:hypothetical protein